MGNPLLTLRGRGCQCGTMELPTYPEAGAVSVGTHDGEPIACLVLATHSKSNDGGEVVDDKILEGKKS